MSAPTPLSVARSIETARALRDFRSARSVTVREPFTTVTPPTPPVCPELDPHPVVAADARRLVALERDRDRAVALCAVHYGKDGVLYRKASERVDHVDMLIVRGRIEGRWE